jgi:UDP-GlcNAc:undecaprenyl-phosphate GlcNAc-1-phosphate transferase
MAHKILQSPAAYGGLDLAGPSMMFLSIVASLIGAGIVSLLVPLVLKECARGRISDRRADLHHTHKRPVPRLGGLALAAAFVCIETFIALASPARGHETPERSIILLSCLAMFGLGLWDDLRGLGAKKKLAGQVLIALTVYFLGIGIQVIRIPFAGGDPIELHGWGGVLTVLWLVGMTNLINLIDGADGLAGGICLMLMVLLAYVGHQEGHIELLTSGMAGALLGFLWFNFPPARIYLGDGGAYLLGFQIGLFSLVNSHKGEVFAALAAPMLALALPILDTSLAIARRGLWGLPIFRPDRRHLHHHLQRIGYSRRKVVFSFYAVTLVFLMLGAAAVWSRGQWLPGLLGFGVLVLLICAGNLSFSREWFDVGRVVGNSLELRREIRYALSLTRWLELEGGRHAAVDELWQDFVFIARKLGFTTIKLTLADGQRVWQQPEVNGPCHAIRHEMHGGASGTLELFAPSCLWKDAPPGTAPPASSCDQP